MRYSYPLIFAFLLVVAMAVPHLSHAHKPEDKMTMQEVKKEVQDLMTALKGYTANQREEALAKTQDALDHLDHRIEKLETQIDKKWDTMSKTAQKEARANLKALREQRVKLAEWTGRLKSSSAEAWDHVKKGFSESYDSLNDAWKNAIEAFDAGK